MVCVCVFGVGESACQVKISCECDEHFILTFPIAKSPLSNNRMTPSVRKASPKVTRPKPISEYLTKFTSVKILNKLNSSSPLTLHVRQRD